MRIGFVGGCESYDIILYLARILKHLGKQVLLIEAAPSQSLRAAIPVPDGIKDGELVEYRGVQFCNGKPNSKFDDYDAILFHFGLNGNYLENCDAIIYCTDQQLHNIHALPNFFREGKKEILIIRDMISCGLSAPYIKQLMQSITGSTYQFYYDETDAKRKLRCQYDSGFYFHGISECMKGYLRDMIFMLYPDLPAKEYRIAYKMAERGK